MALDNFIPEVWIARIMANIHEQLVFAQAGVANRDYEGEFSQAGDTVRITSIGPVTVSDYTKNTDIAAPQDLTDAQRTMIIDRQKYFNFQVDDIDAAQINVSVMDAAMREAAFALTQQVDSRLAGFHTDANAANKIGSDGSPIAPTVANGLAYESLVDLGVVLDEANMPSGDRWTVIPPWYEGLLLKDDRFVSYGTTGNRDALLNGEIGNAAGFRVLKSNTVSNNGTVWRIMAGSGTMAISYADQINKVEAYRPEKRFADAVKGLHVWGSKVLRSEALAVLHADRP